MRLRLSDINWLVDSIKSHVSFAKEPYKRDDILQKRDDILQKVGACAHALHKPNNDVFNIYVWGGFG